VHDEDGDGEVTQDFAGWHRRMLGHASAPVYRAVGRLDDRLALAFNHWARLSPAISRVVRVSAERLAAAEVALMLLLAVSGRRRSAFEMLTSVGAVYLACEVLGMMWPRPRPFERLTGIRAFSGHSAGRSFPSRHVAAGLVMAAIGGEQHPRLGALMAAVAGWLGVSRTMAGLHYPSDVVAGVLLAFVATGVRRSLRATLSR
jgi:membrane-associated phospholipid phosphatase